HLAGGYPAPSAGPMRLALYEPDIPQNTGAILRLAACLGVPVDLIEPCGFLLDDRRVRGARMDYLAAVALTPHSSWGAYLRRRQDAGPHGRLVLLTTRGPTAYTLFRFESSDTLLLGRESSGVPDAVHAAACARIVIPLRGGQRSLNVAIAAAMV